MSVAIPREPPPHAPEGGWSRRLLGPFHVTGVFWFRLHQLGITILPAWALGGLVDLFSTFFWIVLRKIRAAVASNLEAVLGPCGWWERQRRIHRTFHTFAWCLSERYERLSTDRVFTIEAEGVEEWRELVGQAGRLLPVPPPLGAWGVGSVLPASRDRRRGHLAAGPQAGPQAP